MSSTSHSEFFTLLLFFPIFNDDMHDDLQQQQAIAPLAR